MKFVDTHCHLDFRQFDEDREAMIERAYEAGVTRLVIPAIELGNCAAVIRLAEQYEHIFCAVGIHPNMTADYQPAHLYELEALAQHEKVVAIGEIGIDYHWDKSPKETQHRAFAAQMELADGLDLPIIIHNREADRDTIRLLEASPLNGKDRPGVMHSFGGDEFTAHKAIEMGFYLGFTGPITYKKADRSRTIAGQLPLERILIETDAPYLTPKPYRGKRNEPLYVIKVAEKLAEVHGVTLDEICEVTTRNACELFRLA